MSPLPPLHRAAVGLFLLVAIAGCSTADPKPQAQPTASASAAPSPSPSCVNTGQGGEGQNEGCGAVASPSPASASVGVPATLVDARSGALADWTIISAKRMKQSAGAYVKPHDSKDGTYLALDVTARVKSGTWATSALDFTAVPDADTGEPKYQSATVVDGIGDHQLYDGDVPAPKHVSGLVLFDAPPGGYTISLTVSDITVGTAELARWHVSA